MNPKPRVEVWGAGTPRTHRVYWALHELGIEYRAHTFGPRTGVNRSAWYSAINPKQKIPAMRAGEMVLTESGAIITCLNGIVGGGLVPPGSDLSKHARYYEWLCFILMELDAHTLYVMRKHADLAGLYGEAPTAVEAARAGYYKQVAVAEQHLAAGHEWLLGQNFSGVDILLATCVDWARAYQLDVSEVLDEYSTRANARAACAAARAINYRFQEGAEIEVTP